MKRFMVLFIAVGLIVGSVAGAEAKKAESKRVERTVVESYGPYPAPVTGCNEPLESFACMTVPTWGSESFFTAKVTDTHGQPVFVQVTSDGYEHATFCGETNQPIRFSPGAQLRFFVALPVWGVQLECPEHSIKTTGTISVTLSNLPLVGPVRSGTIVTGDGWFLSNQLGGCGMAPDCAAWLESGCDPALTGRDPAVMASIEDVADLADGRTPRVFRHSWAEPVGVPWGGTDVQLWRADCTEVLTSRWRSADCDGDGSGRLCVSTRFRIPTSVRWMTVTGYPDDVHIAWTLT